MALSLGMFRDTEHVVRASACGACGALLANPVVSEDTMFLMDLMRETAAILKIDCNSNVRIRATWLSGIITDVILSIL